MRIGRFGRYRHARIARVRDLENGPKIIRRDIEHAGHVIERHPRLDESGVRRRERLQMMPGKGAEPRSSKGLHLSVPEIPVLEDTETDEHQQHRDEHNNEKTQITIGGVARFHNSSIEPKRPVRYGITIIAAMPDTAPTVFEADKS